MGVLTLQSGCGTSMSARRFPLRDPIWTDDDTHPYSVDCTPDAKKPKHAVCAPDEYESPFVWDGVDQMIFRPIARFFAVDPGGEAVNVNAFDEVPTSSWFTNRIGSRAMTPEEVGKGYCDDKILHPDDPDGSWVIDQGKENGANPGFASTFRASASSSSRPTKRTIPSVPRARRPSPRASITPRGFGPAATLSSTCGARC